MILASNAATTKCRPKKRGEHGHGPREDAARDLFGRAGQAAQAMLDILERARPAAAGPKRLGDRPVSNSVGLAA
jgi:hypothetical protein